MKPAFMMPMRPSSPPQPQPYPIWYSISTTRPVSQRFQRWQRKWAARNISGTPSFSRMCLPMRLRSLSISFSDLQRERCLYRSGLLWQSLCWLFHCFFYSGPVKKRMSDFLENNWKNLENNWKNLVDMDRVI